jgi:ATP-binding cassette, subfamily B, bacterial
MSAPTRDHPPGELEPRRLLTLVPRPNNGTEDEETIPHKPLDWAIIRRLWSYTSAHRARRNWLVFLTITRAVQIPVLTWLMSSAIAGPIARGELDTLTVTCGAYALLAFVTEGMFHFRMRFAQELGESVVHRLRAEIFANLQRQPMAFFHRTKLGQILGRVTSDVESLRVAIQDVFFVCIVQGGHMVVAALVMLWLDWAMFLVVLGLAPVLWKLNDHFRVRISQAARATTESFSRVTATLAESVNGIRVTQGFVREGLNTGLFRSLLFDHSRHNINLARSSATLQPILELNSQFFIAALLLIGGWRTFGGDMEAGEVIKFFFFAGLFFGPIVVVGNLYNQALVAMAGAERVFRLIDRTPEWTDAALARDLPDPRNAGVPPTGLRIEFRAVDFAYERGRPVLSEVSFTAEPGMTVALVGHTGGGKSSIINLVSKFYLPSAGEILLDGQDIRALTGRSVHRQLGFVTQQNFLFTGTVLANLRLARPGLTENEARAAAAALDCLDALEALPRGFATEVGERGVGLSLGQRQLVCIVRAFLTDPRLVILDEATSSVDALTEERLQGALARLMRGRTSLVVAHRLSTIRAADSILVLDQGRVVERGNHASLLAANGRYAELHAQFTSTGVSE